MAHVELTGVLMFLMIFFNVLYFLFTERTRKCY